MSSCEFYKIFKRTFSPEQLRTTASAVGLLIFYRYVEHLEGVILVTVHPFLLKLFSIDLLIYFSMFLIMREMIFRLMILNTLTYLS